MTINDDAKEIKNNDDDNDKIMIEAGQGCIVVLIGLVVFCLGFSRLEISTGSFKMGGSLKIMN